MSTPTTALAVDLIKLDHSMVRQIVFATDPNGSGRYVVLYRQITPTITGKHWKRYATPVSSLEDKSDSWLRQYLAVHQEKGHRIGSIFTVELTESEWAEMHERDQTPRALMTRVDRARESIGAELFKGETRFADDTVAVDKMVETVMNQVTAWRTGNGAPEIAPAGRARTPRKSSATASTTPDKEDNSVRPGTEIVLDDGTVYITREIDSGISDVDFLRAGREANAYTLLYSVPGTGKTRGTQAAFGTDLIEMLGTADTEVSDFVGNYVPTGQPGVFRWVDGPLTVAMDEGRPLLIDEIALIDPRTLSVLYSAMDGRRQLRITLNPARGVVTAKPGFYVVGAFNPGAPGARVSEALLSRFTLQVEYSTDYDAMERLGVPSSFITAAKNLETKRRNDEISYAPQARECLTYKQTAELFGERVALRNAIASAPEQDRAVVADVLSRTLGSRLAGLSTK